MTDYSMFIINFLVVAIAVEILFIIFLLKGFEKELFK